jgi:CDP-6-deoxy-D-xylo-4-hexulose-3-dehydrase
MDSIKLVKDTISKNELDQLIDWLKTYPRLTKGELTIEFEEKWSNWIGRKYSVFVNSGSSANLAAIYSLMLCKNLKNKKIVVPAVSWATTVAPAIQLGLEPIMCDCDIDNLGLNIDHLKQIVEEHNPSSVILVHVLGFPNHMNEILEICKQNDIYLIEDTCESIGSKYNDQYLGTFGDLSTFSFYYGHHISTIEGGMICTDDEDLYHLLISIRSHGWDRDLPQKKQNELRKHYKVNDFNALYTFYYPGFNIRSTDLQAFLGINQIDRLDEIISNRNKNYLLYNDNLNNTFWKINPPTNSYISNFSYPIIHPNIDNMISELVENKIECRPLICGSINEHPFWYERYKKENLKFSSIVHKHGLYLPNNHQMEEDEIFKIAKIINNNL